MKILKMKILKILSKFFFPTLIILLIGFLAWKNYIPGTYLSGWDTLHPEFNLSLYFKRALFGTWMEHQGVGAVASQAHIAELPRLLIVYALDLFLPQNLVRYSFFFLCLALGGLGLYFLAKYFLDLKKLKYAKEASFLAAVFYILNLTTVQQFYVPLEMFAVHFALLPWLFYLGSKYFEDGKRNILMWFAIVSIFSGSMSHTPTLYYVYFVALCLYIFVSFLLKIGKVSLKRGILLVLVSLFLNLYWILPNLYFVAKHSKEVTSSKINTIFSDEAFLQGQSFGDLKNLSLQKNFLFNWREFNSDKNSFVDLMDEWQAHLETRNVETLGYIMFGFAIFGIIISILRKSKYTFAFIPLLLISVFFWINENGVFAEAFRHLREVGILREALRFPFTKFSILLTVTLSVFLAFSSQLILQVLGKIKLSYLFVAGFLLANIYFMLPAFQGNLISPSMKVRVPQEYFQMFKWFEGQDANARVAKFPLQTFWNWGFYSWGYQGGGFTWFGIPQPTLDREFDRWNASNESFYNEAAFALYANDSEAFKKVVEKYSVSYLLLDESIINAGGSADSLFLPQIKKILVENYFKESAKFGFLTIYETNLPQKANVFAPRSFTEINGEATYSQVDQIYSKYNLYIQNDSATAYPFSNLDPRLGISIYESNGQLVFENKKENAKVYLPTTDVLNEDFSKKRGFALPYNCDLKKIGTVGKESEADRVVYTANGGGVSCDYYDYTSTTSQNQSYVLRIVGENLRGRSLKIYLYNPETKKMDLEELMPNGEFDQYFVVLPKNGNDTGYSLNIETRSYGRIASENILKGIEFYPFDYNLLQSIYKGNRNPEIFGNGLVINEVKSTGDAFKAQVKTGEGKNLLVLGQGYEEGWVAMPMRNFQFSILNFQLPDFKNKLEHVKVNSWENGWVVPERFQNIIVVFWPQYLEWGGFGLLVVMFLSVLVWPKKESSKVFRNS